MTLHVRLGALITLSNYNAVAEMERNIDAQAFWRAVIRLYTKDRFEEFRARYKNTDFVVQRFDTVDSRGPKGK